MQVVTVRLLLVQLLMCRGREQQAYLVTVTGLQYFQLTRLLSFFVFIHLSVVYIIFFLPVCQLPMSMK